MRSTRYWLALVFFSMTLVALWLSQPQATVHTVTQINFTFSPGTLTIAAGDTVRWVYGGGTHTVTNGTGAADPSVGSLFDAPLDLTHTSFEYAFAVSGVYPYFCRFHESFGMKGTITVEEATGIPPLVPPNAVLYQNHPNPFGPETVIDYSLFEAGQVKLRIYDTEGRMVATLEKGFRPGGPHRVIWDGRDSAGRLVSTGVYFYRLDVGDRSFTKKLLLLR